MAISVGDLRRLTASFYNSTGNVVDPTKVTLEVEAPDDTLSTYYYSGATSTITKVSTGVYRKDVSLTLPGVYEYDWTGTGTAQAHEGGSFKVSPKATG